MVKLNFSVGSMVSTDEGIKIDLSPKANDHFIKTDGGLTVYTKEEDVEELFDSEDEMVAVIMTPGKYKSFIRNNEQAEDSGKPPYTRNDDGTVTIDGERYVREEKILEIKNSIAGPAAKVQDQQMSKTASTATKESIFDMPSPKLGEALEQRDAERAAVNQPGPDTQID